MLARARNFAILALLLVVMSPVAWAERPTDDPREAPAYAERLGELLDKMPAAVAKANEKIQLMMERLMEALPDDASLASAFEQFKLFLEGLYKKDSGETAPIPNLREVQSQVFGVIDSKTTEDPEMI